MSKDIPKRGGGADFLEETRIDLGEDLLESTAPIAIPLSLGNLEEHPTQKSAADEIEDQLKTAEILQGEGLFEDAKKVLRGILRVHPDQTSAKQKLEEIQTLELKRILEDTPGRKPVAEGSASRDPIGSVDSEGAMRSLDADLKLGIFSEGEIDEASSVASALFKNKKAVEDFALKLDQDLAALSPDDRMDIGIAFFEMGLFEVAARQFRSALRDPGKVLAASSLLAQALILAGRPFEAVLTLEPLFEDSELKQNEKTDLLYLMGRAYESLRKPAIARRWYGQARALQADYRDVEHRLRYLS